MGTRDRGSATRITSRQFNQDTSGAKKAAERGPVYITDRGRPAHVLLSYRAYEELVGIGSVIDMLGQPDGVGDIELTIPQARDTARPASFE
jgi:prevent-host-death family protein